MSIFGTLHVNAGHALHKADREQLMKEFSIRFNGRHYEFGQYRFGRLSDAVDSARRSLAEPPPVWNAKSSRSDPDPAPGVRDAPSKSTHHPTNRLRFALFRPGRRPPG